MFTSKKTAPILLAILLIFLIVYCNIYNVVRSYTFGSNLVRKIELQKRSPLVHYNGTEDYLINTPGCYIPNYSKTLQFKEATNTHQSCGQRAVFIKKVGDNVIIFLVDEEKLAKYRGKTKSVSCCYQFANRSIVSGKEDSEITYTPCAPFQNGTEIKLEHEVITVTCNQQQTNKVKIIYQDAYLMLKRILSKRSNEKESGNTWNILLLGMDTMSEARIFSTMPKTVNYLQQHKWLNYRGYQKVDYNTFPNLMSVMTGKNMSTIYKTCNKGMHECNKYIMWSKFKDAGYITAYGEDFLRLPDTFSRYNGFKIQPTDHYTRPFFLTGEQRKGNLVCTQKLPSALHLLNYASDFTDAYKNEKFFGMFWLNSYSHNLENLPTLIDKDMTDFFVKLNRTGVLNNTFILFFSDHGIRFGNMRLPIESYYEERLPMFFMWVPLKFREIHFEEYYNLQLNQNRLTTPYDVHVTLWKLLKMSNDSVDVIPSEACPQCTSLFEEKSSYRTCENARVDKKWCTCYNIVDIDKNDPSAKHSLNLVVSYIQNFTKTIETTVCKICSPLQLKHLLRSHLYKNEVDNKTYYVMAFEMTPGDVRYEATVEMDGHGYNVVSPIHTISPYNIRGSCVKNPHHREYCVCDIAKRCNKNAKKWKGR